MTSDNIFSKHRGTQNSGTRSSRWLWPVALVVGMFGTLQFHLPQFASRFDVFPGDRGDGRLVPFLLEHWYQVIKGNNSWLSPPMFYPVKGTMGYADLLVAYALPYSALREIGLGIFEASTFTVVLLNFLNYLICFVLLKKVLCLNLLASCAGAFFFAFNSPKLVQLGHLQLQPLIFLPLALIFVLLFVHQAKETDQRKAFVLLSLSALCLDFQLLTGFYPAWFFIFWCSLFLLLAFLFKATRDFILSLLRMFWRAALGATAVFVVGLIPFLIVYVPILREFGGRPFDEVRDLIPRFWSLFLMGERNYLWDNLYAAVLRAYPMHPELQIGIGLVPSLAWLAIAGFAIWLVIKNRKAKSTHGSQAAESEFTASVNQMFLALLILSTTLFYILGMRYWQGYSPWKLVHAIVPGASGVRAVARYVMLLTLPMSIGFAFMIQFAADRISSLKDLTRQRVLLAALVLTVAFGLFEQLARKERFNGYPIKAETAYLNNLAAALPADCQSFYVAVGPGGKRNAFEYQIDAILVSVLRDIPTLNGYSGQLPPGWPLWEVQGVDYETYVKKWIEERKLGGNICRLVIDENSTGLVAY